MVRHRMFVGGQRAFAIGGSRSGAVSDDNLVQDVGLGGRRYQDKGNSSGDHHLQSTYGIPHDSPVWVNLGKWRKECNVARRGIEIISAERGRAVMCP